MREELVRSSHGLIRGTMVAFTWWDWGKPQETSAMIIESPIWVSVWALSE